MAKKKKSGPPKVVMQKNTEKKYIILPLVIAFAGIFIYYFMTQNQFMSTDKAIEYIQSFQKNTGELNDYQNKIGMRDPRTDIKWFQTDDEIRIEFGRMILTWEPEKFFTEDTAGKLRSIGFTYETKKKKDSDEQVLHIYYQGIEIDKYVK